jgi:hypothetical protein
MARRFPPPWTIEDHNDACFIVKDRGGFALAYQAARLTEDHASMSEKISFQDATGTEVSGRFEVSHGMITVTAPDGRTKTAEIEEGTLSPETFGKMLLFLLHHGGRPDD